MVLSVDYIYQYLLNLLRKNQAGGVGNEEFERFWNAEQSAYMDDLLGRFNARNNGKEGANTGLIENETIMQKLSAFITSAVLSTTSGRLTKPDNFVYRLSLMSNGYNCYKINHSQQDSVNHSVIDPPSITNNMYYFLEYEDYYQILPFNTTSATLAYVKAPVDIKWGFTYSPQGEQVYNAGTSVQPLWDSNSCREITKRVLKSIGVSFKDADFTNFGNSVINTGE